MPPRPTRRRADPGAGPPIADDRTASPSPSPAPTGAPQPPSRTRKFTALLDSDTDARFARLLTELRSAVGPIATRPDGAGRLRSGYDPSRADVLRALLAVAESDPAIRHAVEEQVRRDFQHDTTTV